MPSAQEFLMIDLPAGLAALFAAVGCALLGNYLVLRRQALLGDAISHVVFPGIVAAYLLTRSTHPLALLAGALAASLFAALLIEAIRRAGRLEPGAAMGVVFTVMFAAGVVALEQGGAASVHLDVEHALYGNLESTLWLAADGWESLIDPAALAELPASLIALAAACAVIALLIALFFKELALATFDPGLAASLGIAPGLVGAALVAAVATAAVAAFNAVGSILVIAMFICPAAAARMLTDRLSLQLWLSAAAAALAALGGYALAAFGPALIGGDSVSAAGMIAMTAGLLQVLAMLFAPRHGALRRRSRRLPPAAAHI